MAGDLESLEQRPEALEIGNFIQEVEKVTPIFMSLQECSDMETIYISLLEEIIRGFTGIIPWMEFLGKFNMI